MHPEQTELHRKYNALVAEICAPQPLAYRWFCQVVEIARVWDHVVDGDTINIKAADAAFQLVTLEWINNEFYYVNRAVLTAVLTNCMSAWKFHTSHADRVKAYDIYTEIPTALCWLIRGLAGIEHYIPKLRENIDRERWEDTRRDNIPFIIMGLPRSRTAWLAAFLTDGDVHCHHELMRMCKNPHEYPEKFLATTAPIIGDADPTMLLFYESLRERLPKHKVVLIKRPEEEAETACRRMHEEIGRQQSMEAWPKATAAFERVQQICREFPSYDFARLDDRETVKELAEYCTGLPFNEARWNLFDELKITAMPEKVMANQRILP